MTGVRLAERTVSGIEYGIPVPGAENLGFTNGDSGMPGICGDAITPGGCGIPFAGVCGRKK